MATFWCENCGRYCDTNATVVIDGPDGSLWCEDCVTEYEADQELLAKFKDEFDPGEAQEWFDYGPEC